MENILAGIKDADVYIHNVGAFSSTWEHHLNLLQTILRRLCENGFTINPLKYQWAMKSKRNRLAQLLAYTLWFKASEKENRCCPDYGSALYLH